MTDDTNISSDPADSPPAEGQSRAVPTQAQGQGTGGLDTAEREGNAEGSRDDGLEGAETSPALDDAKGSGRK